MWGLEVVFRQIFENISPEITSIYKILDDVYWGQMEVGCGKSILFCRDEVDLSLEFLENKTLLV